MCGINGITFKDKNLIASMNETLRHRGPDAEGFFIDDNVSFGHRLLSIIDTPIGGHQPFISEDNCHVLIYNGEIYNYKELKKYLQAKKINFKSESDTEVLLQGLILEGADFAKRLNGMFAFAYYDKNKSQIILARDRMGMKPLYYTVYKKGIIFSSEIKPILVTGLVESRLNKEALSIFFELGYMPGEMTMFKGIYKLAPGQILIYDINNLKAKKIWFDDLLLSNEKNNFNENELSGLIGKSVIDHTMGLRPFGMYLSGGLDSSIVAYELAHGGVSRPITYTTRFDIKDQSYNEDADVAARFSHEIGAEHTELLITEDDFIDAIEKVVLAVEEPRYHPSRAAYYLLAQEASKKSTVILTGDGGDELFMGYSKYYESQKMSDKFAKYPNFLLNLYFSLKNYKNGKIPLMYLNLQNPLQRWWYLTRTGDGSLSRFTKFKFDPRILFEYYKKMNPPLMSNPSKDMENMLALIDRFSWMAEDSLIMTDKIGMNFGMECRFPILDLNVVKYAQSISSKEKLDAPGTKGLLRSAYKNKLPDYITDKKKTGWRAPSSLWMQSKLKDFVLTVLSDDYYPDSNKIFNLSEVRNFVLSKDSFSQRDLKKFFPIVSFQIWLKKFNVKI